MANQILAGAVFHAGQVIAGVDADNPPYVGPPPMSVGWSYAGLSESERVAPAANGMQLYSDSQLYTNEHSNRTFHDLPEYLEGLPVTVERTQTNPNYGLDDYTFSTSGTLYVIRRGDWSAVESSSGLTGWTLVEDNVGYMGGAGPYGTEIYSKSISAGTYSLNNIFFYAFKMDPPPPPPPSYMAVGARAGSYAYVYDANDLSATPTKLTPPNGSIANENFGQSIVSNANNIFVSAPEYGTTHSQEGVIYAYNINDLSAAPTPLLSGDGHVNKFLGTQLSLSGDRLYAAAYGDNTHGTYSGAVYVYNTNDLSEAPTKLTPIDGAASDFFSGTGGSVAVNSYNLFVGSMNDDDRGSNSGSVYVYDVNDLSVQATKITPSDGAAADTFGRSVVANDDYVVISSHGDDNNNVQQDGSIYVYDANNLSATPTKIVSPEGIQYGRFGYVMDMAEGKLAVGTDDRNRVYVYDTDNLSASPTIVTSPDDSYDFFGTTPIRLREGYLLIGQTHDNEREGSVYAYDLNDLSAAPTKLTSPDGSAQDRFGSWIS